MTTLGKVLVLMQVALSFALAVLAFGLYCNRIDWSTNKISAAEPNKEPPGGELYLRQENVKKAQANLGVSETRWSGERTLLLARQQRRLDDQQWYAGQLDHARNRAAPGDWVQAVVLAPNGQADRQWWAPSRPRLGQPLDPKGQPANYLSLDRFSNEVVAILEEIKKVIEQYTELVKEGERLTNVLIGDPVTKEKGLRQRYDSAQQQLKDVLEEQFRVEPLLVNTRVESQLLLKRRDQLARQVREMEEKLLAARGE
jgi:hypothetical protein